MASKPVILALPVVEQRYSCHGCGNCCRDFTVQLREGDLAKLREQDWERRIGGPVAIAFRGVEYLRQREDGSCMFLMDDGRCRIHVEFGFEAKPIACQLFPFHLTPTSRGTLMGLNFACQSVLENKGAGLPSHSRELMRMASALPELAPDEGRAFAAPMLTDSLRASAAEVEAIASRLDRWLRREEASLGVRVDGLAWIVSSLAQAKLANVRDERFVDLFDALVGALPEELPHHPLESPTSGQRTMLRRAVFARIEDPKLTSAVKRGRWRTALAQLARQRRFARGRGEAPLIAHDWPNGAQLEAVESIAAANDANRAAGIDDLVTRFLRASILGGRCWGAGYYGWPIVRGLQALLLSLACVGWLARLHAAGRRREAIDLSAVRAAIGRVDRTAGRAPWLGSAGERLRLTYLQRDDGLRRLIHALALTRD
jgi:lysine-N-methylase